MPIKTMPLENKTALVTGAASGIGRGIADLFIQRGADVLLVDLNAQTLVENFPAHPESHIMALDITADTAAPSLAKHAEQVLGGLDILVNAAGISPVVPLQDLTMEDWNSVMQVNLNAVFALSQHCSSLLKQSGGGRIINLGSIMSDFAGPGMAAYAVSKHGVLGLTKALASELGEFGVTANCIQPGAIRTGITEQAYNNDETFREFWNNKAAVGRWGKPEDIAFLAGFLASDEASFISGHGIYADGGAMQQV